MQRMDNVKKRIITSIVAIIVLIFALLGITYAYFTTKIKGNEDEKSANVSAGKLELTYGDGNKEIVVENIEPGTVLKTKTFTVKNTGTSRIDNYDVILENVVNELTYYEDLTYTLTCTSDKNDSCKGVENGVFPKYDQLLVTNSIEVGETQSFELTVTYNETNLDQSIDMNKVIHAKVNIIDKMETVTKLNVYGNTLLSYKDGTTVQTPSNPATITSLGTLITDTKDKYYNKYKVDMVLGSKNVVKVDDMVNGSFIKNEDGTYSMWKNSSGRFSKTFTTYIPANNITFSYNCLNYNGNYAKALQFVIKFEDGSNTTQGLGCDKRSVYKTTYYSKNITGIQLYQEGAMALNTYVKFNNLQIEVGKKSTTYEKYNDSNMISLYLDEPLRCVGNKCDYIDFINSKIVRNVASGILQVKSKRTGSNFWDAYIKEYGGTTKFNSISNGGNVLCTHYKSQNGDPGVMEDLSVQPNQGGNAYLYLRDDSQADAVTFNKYLIDNNVIVFAVLETPKEEKISLPGSYNFVSKNVYAKDLNLYSSRVEFEQE